MERLAQAAGKKEVKILIPVCIFIFYLLSFPASAVDDLRVFHRAGQTFITWHEDINRTGEFYKIYRSATAFASTSDLLPSKVIATLPEDTSLYYTDICRGVLNQEQYRPLTRYIIRDLGKPLASGTGLMVNTTGEAGNYYYAITQVTNNSEDKKISPDTTRGPVQETVEDAQPVLVWKSADGLNRVYTHWMDFSAWNKSFDAPRKLNNYCGFLPQQPGIHKAMQYAYSYLVSFPPGYNFAGSKKYPLAVSLHAFGQRYVSHGDGWQVIEFAPDDPNNSWWYGYTEKTDYRVAIPKQGPVVNFTEMRVLEELRQVMALPDVHVDSRKIYAHGQSMGGTGALAFGSRYPAIFSQVYAGQPHTNFNRALLRFRQDLEGKWGTPQLGLKVSNRGRAAVSLQRYDGTRVWDWQNFPRELLRRKSDDMSFLMIDHGTNDSVTRWETQGLPFYLALQSTKRSYYALVNSGTHAWQNFAARGYNGFSYFERVFPNADEANISFTTSSDPFYSHLFEWSGSVRRFGEKIEDTESRFAVTVRTNSREMLVAELTPRGTINFHPRSQEKFRWTNRSLKSGMTIQSGSVTAGLRDVITIPKVQIEPGGNRIEIEKQ
jgi:hypothetical protein